MYQEAFGLGAGGSAGLAGRVVVYALATVSVLVVLFPLLWMPAAALKTNAEIIDPHASLIPANPQRGNIADAWISAPFGRFFLNSAIFSAVTTAGQIATGMLSGYAFAMYDFPGKEGAVLPGAERPDDPVHRGPGSGGPVARRRWLGEHAPRPEPPAGEADTQLVDSLGDPDRTRRILKDADYQDISAEPFLGKLPSSWGGDSRAITSSRPGSAAPLGCRRPWLRRCAPTYAAGESCCISHG